MRAAVAESVGSMAVVDRPEPPDPGPGEVMIRPEAIGICGSDYHFFGGELSAEAGGSHFPRVLGHEVGGTIVAVGPDCRPELTPGRGSRCGRSRSAGTATRAASGVRITARTFS